MPAFIDYNCPSDRLPVHVLIIVVGKYEQKHQNLKGAGHLAQDIFNFWRSNERLFPTDYAIGSIEVLVTDPDKPIFMVHGGKQDKPEAPSSEMVKKSMRAWARRISAREGAMGILHWVGHGFESSEKTDGLILDCEGVMSDGETQDGLSWSRSLHWIDGETDGHPVYCFLDSCRTERLARATYDGLGTCLKPMSQNAVVLTSTRFDQTAFWVNDLKPAAKAAGCKEHALGTRAFLEALESFGARQATSSPARMPITSSAVREAAHHLLLRWRRHMGLDTASAEFNLSNDEAVLFTKKPKSVVEVNLRRITKANACLSKPKQEAVEIVAETATPPFEFRLARKPHSFKLDEGKWGKSVKLEHPHVDIVDGGRVN